MSRGLGDVYKRQALKWLSCQDTANVRSYFRGLLNDEEEGKRAFGIWYLSKVMTRGELESLLNEYMGKESYYYNVVTWLDRFLYAPPEFREMFRRDLQGEAEAFLKDNVF